MDYEGIWIQGIVDSLEEAEEYIQDIEQSRSRRRRRNQYHSDGFYYTVKVWEKTTQLESYRYNFITKRLVKSCLVDATSETESECESENDSSEDDKSIN